MRLLHRLPGSLPTIYDWLPNTALLLEASGATHVCLRDLWQFSEGARHTPRRLGHRPALITNFWKPTCVSEKLRYIIGDSMLTSIESIESPKDKAYAVLATLEWTMKHTHVQRRCSKNNPVTASTK